MLSSPSQALFSGLSCTHCYTLLPALPPTPLQVDDNRAHVHNQILVGTIMSEQREVVVTAATSEFKIWASRDGSLLGHFRDVSEHEVTAIAYDGTSKFFMLGVWVCGRVGVCGEQKAMRRCRLQQTHCKC